MGHEAGREPRLKFFAFGNNAVGVIAVGNVARGVVAIGGTLSVGVVSIGMNAVGPVAIGLNSVGLVSVGAINGIGAMVWAGVNGLGGFGHAYVNSGMTPIAGYAIATIGLIASFFIGDGMRSLRGRARGERAREGAVHTTELARVASGDYPVAIHSAEARGNSDPEMGPIHGVIRDEYGEAEVRFASGIVPKPHVRAIATVKIADEFDQSVETAYRAGAARHRKLTVVALAAETAEPFLATRADLAWFAGRAVGVLSLAALFAVLALGMR